MGHKPNTSTTNHRRMGFGFSLESVLESVIVKQAALLLPLKAVAHGLVLTVPSILPPSFDVIQPCRLSLG